MAHYAAFDVSDNRTSCLPTGATDAAKRRHGGRPPMPGAPVPGARVGHEQAADPWQLPKAERVGVETHRPLLRDGVPLFKRPT
jgi:hypothetical protein